MRISNVTCIQNRRKTTQSVALDGGIIETGGHLRLILGRLTKNEYPTKNLKSTSRLLVGCHTQASGYFWRGTTTVLGFGGPPMTIEPMVP